MFVIISYLFPLCVHTYVCTYMHTYIGEGNGNPPVFLPGKSHGQRNLAGYCQWVARVGHDLAAETTHIYLYAHTFMY